MTAVLAIIANNYGLFFIASFIFTLENDITEVCESDGTIMLCLLLDDAIVVDVEISMQVTDETTNGKTD